MVKQRIVVVGAGFAGLSAASFLAKQGHQVTVLEKNSSLGGRARMFKEKGFTFDMGPSWYWMPDVFERYFNSLGADVHDYLDLVRLDPSYQVVWGQNERFEVPSSKAELAKMFDSLEEGAGERLDEFLADAAYKYEVGMKQLVFNGSANPLSHVNKEVIVGMMKLQLFSSFRKHARKYFSHPKILSIIEFPVLFLGATAKEIPALYSLMNYADIELGTWYPMGGMHKIIEGMVKLATELGVEFQTDAEVLDLTINSGKVKEVLTKSGTFTCDHLINASDYHYFDTKILPPQYRSYSDKYWDQRVMAPSSLLFYLGVDKKIEGLLHHNLFFDEDMEVHSTEIYEEPKWPSKPLFYTCVPSKTDPSVAPEGKENVFILIPIAAGLKEEELVIDHYYEFVMNKLEKYCGTSIKEHVIYKRPFAVKDFEKEYHSFKGNAYGLANTLGQTAFLRPRIKHKKLKNVFHAGQLTLPGPGVPPSLISGELAANELIKKAS